MVSIARKISCIFNLMEKLYNGRELYAQDESLTDELGVDERTLRRYLADIKELYKNIIFTETIKKEVKGRKVTVYKAKNIREDIARIFEFFTNSRDSEFDWLLQLVYENDPSILNRLEQKQKSALEQQIKRDSDVLLFRSNPFEHLSNEKLKKHFAILKTAVKNHEYRTINYNYQKQERIEDAKCLKLIFINNNWYLAIEVVDKFRLIRLAFIEEISYSKKNTYQINVLDKYSEFFATMQNPMSLPFVPKQKALLRVSKESAIYFKEHMKPFFESQSFIRQEDDGGVVFSIYYTQSFEILPFIKSWLPNIEILEPSELFDELKQELERYISKISKYSVN